MLNSNILYDKNYKMKRVIFFVMAACSALLNAGCEPYVVSEQELISLQYKTTDGKVLELDPENFNPAIAANKYGDLGEILFCGNLTTIHASAFENQHRLTMVDMPLGLSILVRVHSIIAIILRRYIFHGQLFVLVIMRSTIVTISRRCIFMEGHQFWVV